MRAEMKRAISGFVAAVALSSALSANAVENTSLADAVRRRDVTVVRTLLKQGASPNAPMLNGTTLLHAAAEMDDPVMVDVLIGAGARVNVADDYGVTPLRLACINGNAQVVAQLLKAGADSNVALPTGETVLMTAAHTGNADVVRLLIESGAEVNVSEPSLGQTALMWAAAEGHADAVQVLIRHGADVHARSRAGYTPFLLSARRGDVATSSVLLNEGAGVDESANDGTTALVIATIRRNTTLVEFLLEKGADANLGPGFTPLHWVAGEWSNQQVNAGRRDENSEWSRFDSLPAPAKLELVKALLAHGANPNSRATRTPSYGPGGGMMTSYIAGATPFLVAARFADVDIMRLLVASSANPSLATTRGVTPLMAAAGVGFGVGANPVPQYRALEAVKLCVELKIDINAANAEGDTALHGAVYRGAEGSDALIQFLVNNGADINAKNAREWTPLTIAEGLYFCTFNTHSPSAAKLLQELGAQPTPANFNRIFGSADDTGLNVNRCK